MIKATIIAQDNKIALAIPDNYIGREVEVLIYAKDELMKQKSGPKKTMGDFSGMLSEEDYLALKKYTEEARHPSVGELEDSNLPAWQKAIIDQRLLSMEHNPNAGIPPDTFIKELEEGLNDEY